MKCKSNVVLFAFIKNQALQTILSHIQNYEPACLYVVIDLPRNENEMLLQQEVKKTIADFIDAGPTESEIEAAKNNLINGFPLRIDSNRKILDNVASIAWNDLPLDTLETWTTQMRAVTREQVIAAYKKNLDIDKLVTVVVGAP